MWKFLNLKMRACFMCAILTFVSAIGLSAATVAQPPDSFVDLQTFSPAETDELTFNIHNGVSKIGDVPNVHGPVLDVCNGSSQCVSGYPGVAIELPQDGKLNFSLTTNITTPNAPMSHCMDESSWTDSDGWTSKYSLANIHTHGLLIKPYVLHGATPAQNVYGDYVFDCVTGKTGFVADGNSHVIGNTITYKDDLAEHALPDSTFSFKQPFGTNWFHPHVHGIAKAQVSLGMAGMIMAGKPEENLCLSVDPVTEHCNINKSNPLWVKTRVRKLLLKDAQLIHTGGDAGIWYNNADQDPGFCKGNETDGSNIGECLPVNPAGMKTLNDVLVDGPPTNPAMTDFSPRWMFTINGQRYPDLNFDKDHPYQLLRLQNASANITYRLSLRRSFSDETVAAPYAFSPTFEVLSMDGAGYNVTASGDAPVVNARELLLMPGSRADILLDSATLCPGSCTSPMAFQLVSAAYQAGYAPSDADTWPQVALAKISVPSAGNPLTAYAVKQRPLSAFMAAAEKKVSVQQIQDSCRLANIPASAYKLKLADGEKRRVYFGIYKGTAIDGSDVEDFVLGASIIKADNSETDLSGNPIDTAHPVRLHTMSMNDELSDLCVEHGQTEIWQLVNISNEVHNFHIHQLKYTIVRDATENPVWRIQSALDQQTLPDGLVMKAGEAELRHDTIVVPRGRTECSSSLTPVQPLPEEGERAYILSHTPFQVPDDPSRDDSRFVNGQCDGSGRIASAPNPSGSPYLDVSGMIELRIPFGGTQLSETNSVPPRFVYHCHILEHEDKGMMASITVLSPH